MPNFIEYWCIYLKGTDNKLKAKNCTLSDNLDHQAHAVWAHMAPILKMVSRNHPETVAVHFFSDSPSSQYRNRFNMHLMKTKVPMFFKKVKYITWNFTEAGHGKGPMDGVGGAMKRRADEYVMHGSDITSARDFINTSKKSNIYITEIPNADVIEMKREVQTTTVQPISNIMKCHQVTYCREIMYSRTLSCFICKPSEYCDHYTMGEIFRANTNYVSDSSSTDEDFKPSETRKGPLIFYKMVYSSSSSDVE